MQRDLRAERNLPDWRDADAYADIVAGGRTALAWEIVRRDPDYQGVSGDSVECDVNRVQIVPVTDAAVTERFGLFFR